MSHSHEHDGVSGRGGDDVADKEWQRVRALADRVAAMEEAVAEMVDPDPDTLARLDRARIKAQRAAQRAQLADSLADTLAEIRLERRSPRRNP